jgi:RP/EB family microtubule-associated protein
MNKTTGESRSDLLKWLNDKFNIQYEKIEQVCTGAAFCVIMDAIFPNKVAMSKVNFNAKFDYEYVQNFKILQSVFSQQSVPRTIEVQRLIQGRYLDNLEFLQFMKKYYDTKVGDDRSQDRPEKRPRENSQTEKPVVKLQNSNPNPKIDFKRDSNRVVSSTPQINPSALSMKMTELQVTVSNLAKERDFYFSKMRQIEILCATQESNPLCDEIKKILYDDQEE